MSSLILDLGALRRAVADQCSAMGLVARASALCNRACDNPGPLRRELLAIRELAHDMHAHAAHEAVSASFVEGLVHAKTATQALRLEKLVAQAIEVADRRLDEMKADAARPIHPGLAVGARKGWR